MGAQLVEFSSGCSTGSLERIVTERPLEWYKVVGIEFVLFAAIVVPLVYGALMGR